MKKVFAVLVFLFVVGNAFAATKYFSDTKSTSTTSYVNRFGIYVQIGVAQQSVVSTGTAYTNSNNIVISATFSGHTYSRATLSANGGTYTYVSPQYTDGGAGTGHGWFDWSLASWIDNSYRNGTTSCTTSIYSDVLGKYLP